MPDGTFVSLSCTSSVSSDVTFSWTSDGGDVTGQSISTGDTSTLTITKVRRKDAGSYVCTAKSGPLSVMSNTATLGVPLFIILLFLSKTKQSSCERGVTFPKMPW